MGITLAAAQVSCLVNLLSISGSKQKIRLDMNLVGVLTGPGLIFFLASVLATLLVFTLFGKRIPRTTPFIAGAFSTVYVMLLACILMALAAQILHWIHPYNADGDTTPGFFGILLAGLWAVGFGLFLTVPLGGYGFKWLAHHPNRTTNPPAQPIPAPSPTRTPFKWLLSHPSPFPQAPTPTPTQTQAQTKKCPNPSEPT